MAAKENYSPATAFDVKTPSIDDVTTHPARRAIQMISLAGVVPIVIFTILIVLFGGQSGFAPPLADAYKIYAALILSFLGGIRWGAVLADATARYPAKTAIIALIAPLTGWISVFLSGPMGFALLIVAFAGQGAWDNIATHDGRLPVWYARTRIILTGISVTSMAVTMYVIA